MDAAHYYAGYLAILYNRENCGGRESGLQYLSAMYALLNAPQ